MNATTATVIAIESNSKAGKTKARYNCTNYLFIQWVFKNSAVYPGIIRPWVVPTLAASDRRDLQEAGGNPAARKYKYFRTAVMAVLKATNPSSNNCPLDMQLVTYEVIATYLTSLKTDDNRFKGMSTYDGARSSLMYLMKQDNVYPPPEFKEKICNILKGFRRTIQQQKVDLGESLNEGKDPLSFSGYNLLCRTFLENNGTNDEFIFAHAFLTLEWNLMCRADNLVSLNIAHTGWEDDSFLCNLAKCKHDQEGEGSKTPWHIYANPTNPFVCPVLALGLYLFSHPALLTNTSSSFLFSGNSQYKRYTHILRKAIRMEETKFQRLGIDTDTTASHSIRKGSSTYAASGCTVAPSMASICNRAGWKMGGTRDKYIKFENAGDQHLGRILCGLNPLSVYFSLTPPFFDTQREEDKEKIDEFIRSRVEESAMIPDGLFVVVRYCFASLCFHREFLKHILEPTSRIHTSMLFMNVPQDILDMAKAVTYKEALTNDNAPRLTGIPPHIIILNNMQGINEHTTDCSVDIVSKIKQDLDARLVGGDQHQANVVLDQVQRVHQEMQTMMQNISARRSGDGVVTALEERSNDEVSIGNGVERRKVYHWGGQLHNVPQNFKIPRMTLGSLISCWFCGDKREKLPPLRFVNSYDFPQKKNGKVLISQWRKMIIHVRRAADTVGFRIPSNSNLSASDCVSLYAAVKPLFRYTSLRTNHKRRYEGILWKTVFNIVTKNKGLFADEVNQL